MPKYTGDGYSLLITVDVSIPYWYAVLVMTFNLASTDAIHTHVHTFATSVAVDILALNSARLSTGSDSSHLKSKICWFFSWESWVIVISIYSSVTWSDNSQWWSVRYREISLIIGLDIISQSIIGQGLVSGFWLRMQEHRQWISNHIPLHTVRCIYLSIPKAGVWGINK